MNFGAAALAALSGPLLAIGGFAAITLMGFVVLAVAVIASIRAGYGTAHTT